MKKSMILLAALAFMAWGCSSSDDDSHQEKRELSEGTQERPAWTVPNFDEYEQTMTVQVTLQDTLQPYASSADLLCASIDQEVRGLATPQLLDDDWVFIITVGSNEAGKPITLHYYCDKLHRIFSTSWGTFDADTPPTGNGSFSQPLFVTKE